MRPRSDIGFRGEYQEATMRSSTPISTGGGLTPLDLAYTLPFLDRLDEAKAQVAKLLKMYPTMTIHEADAFYKMYCFEPSFREKWRARCGRRGSRNS